MAKASKPAKVEPAETPEISQPAIIQPSASNPVATFTPDKRPAKNGMATVLVNGEEKIMARHFANRLKQADPTIQILD